MATIQLLSFKLENKTKIKDNVLIYVKAERIMVEFNHKIINALLTISRHLLMKIKGGISH
ncbi:hypothetical protein DSUL_140034 [Desulfovibrionales bacterium]